MPLFLLTFFLIYGGTHAYALWKAQASLHFGWRTTLFAIPPLAALACGPLVVYALGERGMEGASRAASWVAYSWMGLLFFFTWMNLALDAANVLARIATAASANGSRPLVASGRNTFLALVSLSAILSVYSFFEASNIRLERFRMTTDKLPAGTARIRMAQISDIHLGLMVRHREAAVIAEKVRKAAPDILVSTGDLVDGRLAHLEGLPEIFMDIPAPLGKFAVTGNHEFFAGVGQALDFTRRAGFTVLRGEAVNVGDILRIGGVDDPVGLRYGQARTLDEEKVLGRERSPLFTILLKHRPVLTPAAREAADLQLSGHTHNGQIFPFRLLVRFWFPLIAGPYFSPGGVVLYTSSGTGTWGPPMRFLSPPEVTIIDIERGP